MRMPFTEFITHGDLKFVISFAIFFMVSIYHFFKKLTVKNNTDKDLVAYHNSRINIAANWILILAVLSLLLGFMHSFYFVGKAGGVAPNLIFTGVSYALITPVLGVALHIICKTLKAINKKSIKS
ncbi:MAG: hypothetical protein R3342_00800 [Lutibacter sp.]|uniref:hypothetical protein n=1 Tax=Lutibacter sp. TaxID=1925666 RepID=UPI00299D9476|nr:hypothetical protein [Lutibacter sp.]MDX1828058.1 hypothetical protein [Lutibacter sp.]